MQRRSIQTLIALAVALAVGGCGELVTAKHWPPIDVQVYVVPAVLAVGDSAHIDAVVLRDGTPVRDPALRVSLADSTVARLRGAWLVAHRAGRVVLHAETNGARDSTTVEVR